MSWVMWCGEEMPCHFSGLRVSGLSSVRLCSLKRSFKRLLVSPKYWRLRKSVNVNPQSLYLKKAGVASRKIVLRFKNNSVLYWFLLKKYSLWN